MANERKGNSIIIGVLLVVVLLMSIGFAAGASNLKVTSTATITGKWDVTITKVERIDTNGGAIEDYKNIEDVFETDHYVTTAIFNLDLAQPGDYAEYEVTVSNRGTLDAKLEEITKTLMDGGTDAIEYTVTPTPETAKDSVLVAGDTQKFTVKVLYKLDAIGDNAPEVNATNSLTLTLNYVQAN